MKKAAILTLYYKNDNYGGIAQAYALQQYVGSLGWEAEVISYERTTPPFLKGPAFRRNPVRFVTAKASHLPQKLAQRLRDRAADAEYGKKLRGRLRRRSEAFARSRELVRHSAHYTDGTIGEIRDQYDIFISGSDQIWKPGTIRPAFLCDFLDGDQDRISYASSIAVRELPEEYGQFMKQYLPAYRCISVREEAARQYLKELLRREVALTADPVFLLPPSQWKALCPPRKVPGKYVFVYLLGQDAAQRKKIRAWAEAHSLRIVFLPHVEGRVRACDIGFADTELYDVDLPAFLSLIRHAEYVCTDSFHALAFSILFRRPFYYFERVVLYHNGDMGSRVTTLLERAGLLDRIVKDRFSSCGIDYRAVEENLRPFIDYSRKWLEEALAGAGPAT